ncbi:hypothetical protein BV25DRAFT_1796388 [Artomyces pyxidatus]|uniref:Uncharacterized protein n=1 Tax=Artomyces pyxidatus TaxID=48021 RepID=A0ACB8TDA0_9AGAM|nr:hypothetical protein BV25DRAFT_1796388 [Artomyces pyxidatus]
MLELSDPGEGTIERGHVYFFYRPKVEHKEAHSIDDVSRFHMLLVPRPPELSTYGQDETGTQQQDEDTEMKVLGSGADAVPAKETRDTAKKHYRLISIGKKQLPEPAHGGGHGGGRKDTFWATVTAVGDDLHSVEKGLGEKSYETKTRGTRHEAPSRLAGRGAYAIVNNEARVPSQRETHFGYHLSHPSEMGEIQEALGMHTASSFVLQVKNPLAPVTGGQRVGLSEDRRAKYPDWIMGDIFGKGGKRGRESYGLRFSSVEAIELLEYEGAELLFIAARSGEEGLETSLGEGRGEALREIETKESKETIEEVLRELALHADQFPTEPLEGHWI